MLNIIFLNSHPIQYYAPLYKELSLSKKINIEVWYLSDHGIREDIDIQFGAIFKWDIPLLEGYNYIFLKNNSLKPGINNGFFGLLNLELIKMVKNLPKKSIIVIPGWNYLSYWIAILTAFFYRKHVAFRSESPLSHEKNKSTFNKFFRTFLFKKFLFKQISYAFFVGKENFNFYKYFNIKNEKLVYTPYCVDNERFQMQYDNLFKNSNKQIVRESLNIPIDKKIILYSGKFIKKKNPVDVIKAFSMLNNKNTFLIFMGDGELKNEILNYVNKHNLNERVLITGFINQSEIAKYYFISDIFVMASSFGETWGLSVNEAMNFKLPIVVSNLTGSSSDLVCSNKNGYTFECGNISDLKLKLDLILSLNDADIKEFGENSRNIINMYTFKIIRENLEKIILK